MTGEFHPLEVEATDERMVFLVRSETNPQRPPYRVDLLANEGRGECGCRHWLTGIWPIIRDGGEATCKHVDAARRSFLRDLLRHLARQESDR